MSSTGGGTEDITVTVRYFAGAKATVGLPEESVDVPEPATVAELVGALIERHGSRLAQVLAASAFLVDETAGGRERPLRDGVRVDVLPPFTGG
jgi:molybdopterin converting factor small subunit